LKALCSRHDQSARLGLAELKSEIGRHRIGRIFLAPKQRQIKHVEQGMGEFVQGRIEKGADDRVDRGNTVRCRFRRHVLPQLVDIFIANRDDIVPVEGVGLSIASRE
jgi:hypothetical protein